MFARNVLRLQDPVKMTILVWPYHTKQKIQTLTAHLWKVSTRKCQGIWGNVINATSFSQLYLQFLFTIVLSKGNFSFHYEKETSCPNSLKDIKYLVTHFLAVLIKFETHLETWAYWYICSAIIWQNLVSCILCRHRASFYEKAYLKILISSTMKMIAGNNHSV